MAPFTTTLTLEEWCDLGLALEMTRTTNLFPSRREHMTALQARLFREYGEWASNLDDLGRVAARAQLDQLYALLDDLPRR